MRLTTVTPLLALLPLLCCVSPEPTGEVDAKPEIIESSKRYRKEYVLFPGDSIDVVVRENAAMTRRCVIRPDGYITLPILNDVKAAGFTCRELAGRLTESLGERLKEPEVTVIAVDVRPSMVFVQGEVAKPAPVDYRHALTAFQAIANAGGFTDAADKESLIVIRLTEEGHLRGMKIPITVGGQPAPYMAAQNFALQPDDILFVPRSDMGQVNAWIRTHVTEPTSAFANLFAFYASFRLVEQVNR